MTSIDIEKRLETIAKMGLSPAMQRNQAQSLADQVFMAGGPPAAAEAHRQIATAGLAPKLVVDVLREEGPDALRNWK